VPEGRRGQLTEHVLAWLLMSLEVLDPKEYWTKGLMRWSM
jgi:hypothetical protein